MYSDINEAYAAIIGRVAPDVVKQLDRYQQEVKGFNRKEVVAAIAKKYLMADLYEIVAMQLGQDLPKFNTYDRLHFVGLSYELPLFSGDFKNAWEIFQKEQDGANLFIFYADCLLTGDLNLISQAKAAITADIDYQDQLPWRHECRHELVRYAAASGSLEVIKFITSELESIALRPDAPNIKVSDRVSLLHYLMIAGNTELIEQVIRAIARQSGMDSFERRYGKFEVDCITASLQSVCRAMPDPANRSLLFSCEDDSEQREMIGLPYVAALLGYEGIKNIFDRDYGGVKLPGLQLAPSDPLARADSLITVLVMLASEDSNPELSEKFNHALFRCLEMYPPDKWLGPKDPTDAWDILKYAFIGAKESKIFERLLAIFMRFETDWLFNVFEVDDCLYGYADMILKCLDDLFVNFPAKEFYERGKLFLPLFDDDKFARNSGYLLFKLRVTIEEQRSVKPKSPQAHIGSAMKVIDAAKLVLNKIYDTPRPASHLDMWETLKRSVLMRAIDELQEQFDLHDEKSQQNFLSRLVGVGEAFQEPSNSRLRPPHTAEIDSLVAKFFVCKKADWYIYSEPNSSLAVGFDL